MLIAGPSISGPTEVCPSQPTFYNFDPDTNGECDDVEWKIFLPGNPNPFITTTTGTSSLSYTWPSNVQTGLATIEARGSVCCALRVPCNRSASLTVIVGPVPNGPITGSSIICAGSSKTYSYSVSPSATSYTWTVPNSSWKVDGISGPVVTGRTGSVSIKAPSGAFWRL